MGGASLPSSVRIYEVGPRDGLQNEVAYVPLKSKVAMINKLTEAGLLFIEAASFVPPAVVPAMGDSKGVMAGIERKPGVIYAALTPNMKGFQSAVEAECEEVALFVSASEGFSQMNLRCSIEESFQRIGPVFDAAKQHGIRLRGYASCIFECPRDGPVDPEQVRVVTQRLLDLGCYEVSLGDTTGVGTPGSTQRLLSHLLKTIPASQLAMHFHDTYGQALANVLVSLQNGITSMDSSVGGLGGCPFAPGATGNVATEDLVYMLHGMGIHTGIDLPKLIEAADCVSPSLSNGPESLKSKVNQALKIKLRKKLDQR